MIRVVLVFAALLSPFLFPFPVTLLLMFAAATFLPVAALVVGILVDVLYYSPEASFLPVGVLSGAVLALLGLLVRRFVKARIISA